MQAISSRKDFDMKIIIAGAGFGGLQAAKTLAAKGHEVTIYEKMSEDEIGRNWFDDVDYKVVSDLGIKLPEGSYRTEDITMVPPFTEDNITVSVPKEQRNWRVNRRLLQTQMIKDALAKGAKIIYDTPCRKLIIKGDKIGGIVAGKEKEKIYCDLVIDSTGIGSPLKRSLPDEFDIVKEPAESEYYSAFRGIFDTYPDQPLPKQKKKIFVKFMGQNGLSRVICEPDGRIDVFISKLGRMSRFEYETLFRQLRIENQFIGYEDLEKCLFAKLPARFPLTKMVADGYAAVGDSAFMATSMLGCGIADSIRGGQILADTIVEADTYTAKALWKYQVTYFKQVAADRFYYDGLRRALFNSKSDEVRFLLEGGFLTEAELKDIVLGKGIYSSVGFILSKFSVGRRKFKYFVEVIKALSKAKKAVALANQIPSRYDNGRVNSWQNKINELYKD